MKTATSELIGPQPTTLPVELLTNQQMGVADRFAIQSGISGHFLMQRAGQHVANQVEALGLGPCCVHVVAGPGNNGGDGFVAAKALKERGYKVSLDLTCKVQSLKGDAGRAAGEWQAAGGKVREIDPGQQLPVADVIIDALFGAGLDRPVTGNHKNIIEAINAHQATIISVDVPSGVSGNRGAVLGAAVQADQTVTFFRLKPGHLLYPGRQRAGSTSLHDIGIPERALETIKPVTHLNHPVHWPEWADQGAQTAHKYKKGAVLVARGFDPEGEGAMPGASLLAASAALRAGAGLVTLVKEKDEQLNLPLAALMTTAPTSPDGWRQLIDEKKINTVLFGPGAQPGNTTRSHVEALLKANVHLCLDAGALTAFATEGDQLIKILKATRAHSLTLTPHEGEFERLFGKIGEQGKLEAACRISRETGAILVLKGADTVIAAPDGKAIINANAPASLATAGTGDVLAGIISAHLARGLEPFLAAASGVYLHAMAAFEPVNDLVADDLLMSLPTAQKRLHKIINS